MCRSAPGSPTLSRTRTILYTQLFTCARIPANVDRRRFTRGDATRMCFEAGVLDSYAIRGASDNLVPTPRTWGHRYRSPASAERCRLKRRPRFEGCAYRSPRSTGGARRRRAALRAKHQRIRWLLQADPGRRRHAERDRLPDLRGPRHTPSLVRIQPRA